MEEKTTKNGFNKLEQDADSEMESGEFKYAIEKYTVLLNYYKLNKDTEKEKNTAKKIITAYLDIADKSLENEEKIKNSSNVELAKKAVLAIIDGIEISEKYGFDRIAEKLYKKSIAICYSKGMYKYAEEIEQKRVKNAGKKYGNAESKSYF